MKSVGVKGSRVTLKVKQRKQGARPPPKFLGHGSCHNLSKSAETSGSIPTKESSVIFRIALKLLEQLNVPTDDIRGMGIVVSKLVGEDDKAKGGDVESPARITSWFGQSTAKKMSDSTERSSSHRSLTDSFDRVGDSLGSSADGDQRNAPDAESKSTSVVETSAAPTFSQINGKDDVTSSPGMNDEEVDHHNCCCDEKTIGSPSMPSAIDERQSKQDSDLDDDIALPSFSQLHMSQVAELPSPMRKSIAARISTGGLVAASVDSCRHKPAAATSNTVVKPRVAARRPNVDHSKEGASMKQLSVKRMFKLAAVKSGQDETLSDSLGGSVSLTQLECLPLDMQLQVANNEEIFSGHRSPSSARTKRRRSMASEPAPRTHTKGLQSTGTIASEQEEYLGQNDEPVVQYRAPLISEQLSFYQENIAPLMHFMDVNSEAGREAVQNVQEFLHIICVNERRFPDVVKLLRSIKNRNDAWSGNVYREILASVNDQIQASLGKPLDLKGLSL